MTFLPNPHQRMIKHYDITILNESTTPGFRFAIMEKAYRLAITGYVRRKKSGGVFIEAEGEEDNLEAFLQWCKKGPLGSLIIEVTFNEGEVKGYKSFDIQH